MNSGRERMETKAHCMPSRRKARRPMPRKLYMQLFPPEREQSKRSREGVLKMQGPVRIFRLETQAS